jgi:TolB-like protein/DNA-binding winged helix-turn-helix (wHTH) protein
MNYRFLDYDLSEIDFCLSREGERIPLEPKALRVLFLLVSRAGRLVDKQELLELVWPGTFVEENTLTRTIVNLRKQLGDSSRDSKLIETVPTRGYRFIAPLEIVQLSAAVPPQELPRQTEPSASESDALVGRSPASDLKAINPSLAATPTQTTKRNWLIAAAVLVLATTIGFWIRYHLQHADGPIRSLAVLPLEDLSPGTKEDYFADGMTDELITELARIPALRVVSRTSVMQDKGARKSLAQIARELNVDAVVEGSVLRSGDRIRITAQLIDARSDKHLWAQTFEEPSGDILSLQDSVAREIALQTSSVLTPAARASLTHSKHVNPEAHDDFLHGLYFIQRRDADLAVSYFQKAIALDPEYGAAHAGLAEALVTQVLTRGQHAAEIMPSAVAAANRAIELDPYSGEAYTALGAIDTHYLWDWNAAEKNLRKGIELSPSSSDAETWYAIYLTSVGRPAEAVTAMQRAVALDPFSFWANRLLGSMLFYSRRYDESLVALKRSLEIAPDKVEFVEGWNSDVYEAQGRYSDALEADLKDIASELSPKEVESFRSAFKIGGWKAYQEARVKFMLPHAMTECHMNPLAMSYFRLGNLPETFRWLNRDLDNRCGRAVFDMSSDPRLDSLRTDPRFAALLHRANLPH